MYKNSKKVVMMEAKEYKNLLEMAYTFSTEAWPNADFTIAIPENIINSF